MKISRVVSLFALLMTAIAMFAQTAQADPIVWTLEDLVFNDGTMVTGSFTYDAGTNTYSNWNISVNAVTTAVFGFSTYTYSSGVDQGGGSR